MATSGSKAEELLKRPLYVYDLPEELLATLTTKANTAQTPTPGLLATGQDTAQPTPAGAEERGKDEETGIATATNCSVCQVSFLNVDEQREHVRSDHHRYNVKARLRGNRTLDEAEFNKAIGDLDESISGSESESDEADTEDNEADKTAPDATLAALLKRQAKLASPGPDANQVVTGKKKAGAGREPLLWFTSVALEKNTFLGVYKSLFTDVEQDEPDHLVDSLRNKQTHRRVRNSSNKDTAAASASKEDPHVFLCMIGGGHFAAMVVALPPEVHKRAGGVEDRQARVLAHKTFHRYTTRRKQGGSQSAMDSAKGAASSAGSSLRRYNEAALEKEIRQLLQDWKGMIDESQLLFVKAAGVTNRRILFGAHEGQVLRQSDSRLRGFPFSTRRPTQSELMRAFTELTRVKVRHIDEAELAKAAEKQHPMSEAETAATSPKPSPKPQKQPKVSKEEEAALLHTSQIQALIRRSKVPALLSYLSNNSIPASFTFHPPTSPQNYRSPTPLHLAASSNTPAIVTALLTKALSDPTSVNGEGKLPFDLASDRPTRDAFRVARHNLGESAWDWDAAHVPSPISKAEADSRAEAEKKEAEATEAQRRKDEIERLKQEEEARAASPGKKKSGSSNRTLAAAEKSFAEKREEETRGMTPEMRARLERERRARAAEERIRKMQAPPQS